MVTNDLLIIGKITIQNIPVLIVSKIIFRNFFGTVILYYWEMNIEKILEIIFDNTYNKIENIINLKNLILDVVNNVKTHDDHNVNQIVMFLQID